MMLLRICRIARLADWDHLKIALAVDRGGSLTAAASLLGLDQTTVGRRLAALEADLGETLFLRSRRGFRATEAGALVLAEARAIEARIEGMHDALASHRSSIGGLLRLAGNTWMLEMLARGALPRLLAANPALELRLSGRLPPGPRSAEPGLALWFDAEPQGGEVALPFVTVPYGVYRASEAAPAQDAWVQFRDDLASGPSFTRQVTRRLPEGARVRMTATDARILASAVLGGAGLGILPRCIGDREPGFARASDIEGPIERVLHLHLNPDTARLPRLRALLDCLSEAAPGLFEGRLLLRPRDLETLGA